MNRPTSTPHQMEVLDAYRRLGDWRAVADELVVPSSNVRRNAGKAYERLGVNGAIQAFRVLGWLL
jgi:DNA-binding NarL/FixJ family response regulator